MPAEDPAYRLAQQADAFRATFRSAQLAAAEEGFPWYPYDSLSNFNLFGAIATAPYRDIAALAPNKRILDIGSADGATSFFLASQGFNVDTIDFAPTNFNSMRGLHALSGYFKSSVDIYSVDLDSQFSFPHSNYDLTLFLGILYHLKNPFFALERLSRSTRYCFLSTRVAKFDPSKTSRMEHLPVAYLVSPTETNNDPTNFWIFSKAGLLRLFDRTGWDVCCYGHFGNVQDSDPATNAGDERAFYLLQSKHSRIA